MLFSLISDINGMMIGKLLTIAFLICGKYLYGNALLLMSHCNVAQIRTDKTPKRLCYLVPQNAALRSKHVLYLLLQCIRIKAIVALGLLGL